jgi:hypothetical protein
MWQEREAARSHDNVGALAAFDTGAALDRDVGLTRYAKGLGVPSRRRERPLGPSVVIVPYQTHYPISFLAFVETSGDFSPASAAQTQIGYETVLLVLTKVGQSEPWHVAVETHYAGGFGFTPPPSNAYAPTEPSGGWVTPLDALTDLARFDQQAVKTGRFPAGSLFAAGPWTTGANSAIANDGVDGPIDGGVVIHAHTYGIQPQADGVYQFDAMGVNLACGTVRVHGVLTPTSPRGYLFQNTARTNYGGWIAPGDYRVIHTSELNQVCVQIAPTASGGMRVVSGESGLDEWSATGTPR